MSQQGVSTPPPRRWLTGGSEIALSHPCFLLNEDHVQDDMRGMSFVVCSGVSSSIERALCPKESSFALSQSTEPSCL
eukprot:47773-Eustigmatos_ZCMA.PRE.1